MPIFVISNQFIYYIVILQILSNLSLNGQNVSDSVLTVITKKKKMVKIFFRGGNAPLDLPLTLITVKMNSHLPSCRAVIFSIPGIYMHL